MCVGIEICKKKVIKISLIGCGFRKGKKISTKKNYFHITEWEKKYCKSYIVIGI